MYKVVVFTDDNELAVVPSNWLDDTGFCLWPPYRSSSKLTKAVQNQESASHLWKAYPVRLLPGGGSDNYERAREKLRLAEDTSDLQTVDSEDDENASRHSKRRKRNSHRLISDDGDESDDSNPGIPPHTVQLQPISCGKVRSGQSTPRSPLLPVPPQNSLPQVPVVQPSTSHQESNTNNPVHEQCTILSCERNFNQSERRRVCDVIGGTFFRGMNLRILKTLEQIREDVIYLSQKLNRVLRRLDSMENMGKEVGHELPEELTLPIEDLAALNQVETLLLSESTVRALVSKLGLVGGETVKETTVRIMAHAVSHSLALQLNWMGKGEKTAFSSQRLKDVVFQAVRKNQMCRNATACEMEKCVKDWLRCAADRNGARKQRFIKAAAAAAATAAINH